MKLDGDCLIQITNGKNPNNFGNVPLWQLREYLGSSKADQDEYKRTLKEVNRLKKEATEREKADVIRLKKEEVEQTKLAKVEAKISNLEPKKKTLNNPDIYPKSTGGSWYQLSNGNKAQGKTKALKLQKELDNAS